MRIAFISPNREQLPDPVPPLGLLYLMAAAGEAHERTLIDLCFEDRPLDHLAGQLDAFRPDLVAVGMRNIHNADYTDTGTTLAWYDEVVRAIRRRTAAPIVMGGGGFSILAPALMQRYGLDYGVVGEGERPFAALVAHLAQESGDPPDVPGLLARDAVTGEGPESRRVFAELSSSLRPERRWVDPRYYEHSGITSVQSKRGCAMRCDYCTYPAIEGRIIRRREAQQVAREWREAVEAHPDISHVFVVDAVFNHPPSHARAVCEALVAEGLSHPWTCYLNPLGFDRSLAEAMARAGCAGVEIGSDSGTDAGLARLHKGFTTAQIRRAAADCRAAGIKDCHTFVLGTRGETLEDVERSLDFIESLDPFAAILMAYKDDHEAVDPGLARELGDFRQQVLAAIERRARSRPSWSVPSTGLRFDPRLFAYMRRAGARGPLWQHAR